jgi:radical SAM enzyme (TIGR01210 family)
VRYEQPAQVELSTVRVGGRAARRLMVVLRAPGCGYARRTGGCTNCGFHHLTTGGAPVSTEELAAQLEHALARHAAELDAVGQLDLYCSGSLFSDEEIPPAARARLLARAARLPALARVLVDSRPEFVTEAALAEARAACAPKALEVALGLESADDRIRLERIRKGFSLASFERAARAIAAAGAGLVVYLLLKPLGSGEQEALRDVVASGRYLAALARELGVSVRIALEPVFVVSRTPLWDELVAGRYQPPSLWSVARAVLALAEPGLEVAVGLSDEGLPGQRLPAGCPRCTPLLRAALARWNESGDRAALDALSCPCQQPVQPDSGG